MHDTPSYEDIVQYEVERARVKAHYTTRLKALSSADPEYGRLWDERIEALRTLADKYSLPKEA